MIQILAVFLSMLMACLGFSAAEPVETAMEPEEASEETLSPGDIGHELAQDSAKALDLDGDGETETVTWRVCAQNDGEEWVQLAVTAADGTEIEWRADLLNSQRVYAVDLDGDGATELFVSGDEMSDDYVTYCLRYSEGALHPLSFANAFRGEVDGAEDRDVGFGMLTAFGDGRVELTGAQDVLGTYFGSRQFALKGEHFDLADDGLWHFERYPSDDAMWENWSLTPIEPIFATFVSGDVATEGTLNVGEKLMITASDQTSIAWFVTQEGREGYLRIEPDEERGWGMRVNGIPEDELFERVPYAD